MPRFSPMSDVLWPRTAPPAPEASPLAGDIEAEICIVGAGFCGLHTALSLSKEGRSVVVLEAEEVGFGGSGRNAGHCTPTFHHHSLSGVTEMLGARRSEALIQLQLNASDRIGEIVRDYQIDCEWVQNGYVMCASTRGRMAAMTRKRDDYNGAGQATRLADADEVMQLTGMHGQFGGWVHPGGAHLNPMGLSRGLARAAEEHGARTHIHSPVKGAVRDAAKWRVTTPGGTVTADKLIFATGAYTQGGWSRLERTFRIMRVMVGATRPMSNAADVLPKNVTAHDGRGNILVYKLDAFGRIVASMFPRLMGGRVRMLRLLESRLRYHHPSLPERLEWECLWTGELDMQRNTIPRLYRLGEGAVAVTGLSGRGVPTGWTVGQVLADWANEVPEADLALPIEPLAQAPAYMAIAPQLALRAYELRDRWDEWRDGQSARPW